MKKLVIYALAVLTCTITAQQKSFKRTFVPYTAKSNAIAAPPSTFYSFSTFTAAYTTITGVSVTNSLMWDEDIDTVPIGFNFKLYNVQNDSISFIGGSYATFNDVVNDPLLTAAAPMFEDLCDKAFDPNVNVEGDPGGISNISYTTTGTVGSRICKIEVNNGGFYGENSNGPSASTVNYQVWLYETSNNIEFRFGACTLLNPLDNFLNPGGFISGLVDDLDYNTVTATNSNLLNGPHANPTMVGLSPTATDYITGTPQSGRVYKFTNTTITSVKTNSKPTGIKLYPNPAKDKLYLANISSELNNATLEFYDVAGKLIHSEKLNEQIDLSSFTKGIYLLKVKTQNNESVLINKIVIAE
jgi:hypothetical protein